MPRRLQFMTEIKSRSRSIPSPKHRGDDTRGVHLWLVLMKAHAALLEHARHSIRALDLGDSDFFILEALLHKGPLPVNTIGAKVNLTSGSISVAIDRLAARGLVKRVETAGDRRVRVVELTAAGRTLIECAFGRHAEHMQHAAAVLNA